MPGNMKSLDEGMSANRLPQNPEFAWTLLKWSPEAIGAVTSNGIIAYLNPAAEELLGVELSAAQGRAWNDVVSLFDETGRNPFTAPPSSWTRPEVLPQPPTHLLLRRQGTDRPVQVSAAAIGDRAEEPTPGVVIVMRDIADTHNLLLSLSYRCSHDPLTNLVNREEFDKRLKLALRKARNHDYRYALLYMDLDRFKAINDTYGHIAGDQVLTQMANRLRTVVRERDTLARLGGDEFGLLMEHCSIEEAGRIARTLNNAVNQQPFSFAGHIFRLGISIGVVGIDSRCKDMVSVISAADAACYLAKRKEYNGIFVQHSDQAASSPHLYRPR